MRPAVSASPERTVVRTSIKLRDDKYVLYTNILGYTTNPARAKLFDYSVDTIQRTRNGGDASGPFVGNTLWVLGELHGETFERLKLPVDFNTFFVIEAGP